MNRRRFVVTGASLGAVAAAVAAGCAGGRFGVNPAGGLQSLFRPSGGRTRLSIQYASTTIGGKKFHTRTWNGAIPGPTIHTNPGEYLDVTIANKMPDNSPVKCPTGPSMVPIVHDEMDEMKSPQKWKLERVEAPVDCMNNPHDFNTTNLHVHGIQTTPHLFDPIGTGLASAPMIGIEPRKSFSYSLPVPHNHPSGLHWYHPHHHGATDTQVAGGMAGLIVVHGPIDQVPEIAAARQLFVVLQSIKVNDSTKYPGEFDLEYVPYANPNYGGYSLDTKYTMYTVATESDAGRALTPVMWREKNGTVAEGADTYTPYPPPTFAMRPGEVVRVRLLNGMNADTIPLTMTPGMDVWQIGFDGVNLLKPSLIDMTADNVNGDLAPDNFIDANVRMTVPGNRIELLIRADNPGTYTLASKKADAIHGPGADIPLLKFVVSGSSLSMKIPNSLPKPDREYFTSPVGIRKRVFTFSFANKNAASTVLTGFYFKINDMLYMEDQVPTTVPLEAVEDWEIRNTTGAIHPFHIHVNSFQLLEINGKPNDPIEIWDTFYLPPKSSVKAGQPGFDQYGSIKIRIKFQQFRGKSVFHCHFLSHEDTGMMQNFTIQ